ncbi:MAG TPA: pentapeptide repeat-containing protein [Terriglobia bacterium]|nr:pentapeptide repeat-containing protein [Terriglobia bacterium]
MAGVEHLLLLRQSIEIWNQWRKKDPTIKPYLREAVPRQVNLSANLREANLRKADLSGSKLVGANLRAQIFSEPASSAPI